MSADSGTSEGCLRKAWFEKKKKLKGPEKEWQTLGRDIHKEFEDYLTLGDRSALGPYALPLLPYLPKPKTEDPRILLEHEIGGGALATAPLRARGIPIVGYIDCYSWQDDVHLVLDYKTGNPNYFKNDVDVSRTLQMTTYGKWAVDTRGATEVRLEHGYVATTGPKMAKRVGLLVHQDQINKRWEYVDKLVGSLIDAVKEEDADKVPANTRACSAFRGCDHRAYCSAANHNSLASLISRSKNTVTKLSQIQVNPKENMASVLDQLKSNLAKKQETPAPAPTAPAAPAPAAPTVSKESEMARLALEEIQTRWPRVKQAIADLAAMGVGRPQLSGEAARVYALLDGTPLTPGAGLPALGTQLTGVNIFDPDGIEKLVAELKSVPKVVDPFPDDAPVELAKPSDPPKEKPITTAVEALAEGLEPKKKGKKKKAEAEPATEAKVEQIRAQEPKPGTPEYRETMPAPDTNTQIFLYVDCLPSVPTKSLWTVVNDITTQMAKELGGNDYRTLDPQGPAGFGRHKGLVAAALRQAFVEGEIPGGHWLLDGARNSELGSTVVEAMREIVAHTNGIIVRGIL